MDTKQAKPVAKLIKARVKPGNKYGMATEGEIVEVEASELDLVPHCLESLDAEKQREAEKVKAVEADAERLKVLADRRAALFAARDAAIAGRKIARERALQRQLDAQKAAG
jgi:hypothetical protein